MMMTYGRHKYLGFLGFLSLIGLKGFDTHNYVWCIFLVNYIWFTFFYENSPVYKHQIPFLKQ